MTVDSSATFQRRRSIDRLFAGLCCVAAMAGVAALLFIVGRIASDGLPNLSVRFLISGLSHRPNETGILPALIGSAWVVTLSMVLAAPIGVGAGIYLEEFAKGSKGLARVLRVAAANLAGVPSIIYGLAGLAVFVRWMALGQTVLAGALTMSLVILPMIVVVTQEALRAVPASYREAALGLGSNQWQAIRHQVLPSASRGILTGLLLSVGRAMGETAPLIMVGAAYYVTSAPAALNDQYTVMPMQIFNWASDARREFHSAAAAATLVLLALLLTLNGTVLVIRNRIRARQNAPSG